MWKNLPSTEYYIIFNQSSLTLFEVYVTNFISLWGKHLHKTALIATMKESNVGLEMDEVELMNKGIEMLRKPEEITKVDVKIEETNLDMKLIKMSGFPLKIKLLLLEGPKELFFQKVTYPLLQSAQELRKSQQTLCQLLINKDKEIKEYKAEGGQIDRYLKTPHFDANKHLSAHGCHAKNFGFTELPQALIDKANTVVVKQEIAECKPAPSEIPPVEVKQEAHSETNTVKQEVNTPSSQPLPVRKRKKILNL